MTRSGEASRNSCPTAIAISCQTPIQNSTPSSLYDFI